MKSYTEDCFHLGVKALILNNEGKLLLLERDLPSKKYWDIPGGRLQKGESLMDTLVREVKEETGLDHFNQVCPFTMLLTNIRIRTQDDEVGLIFSVFRCDISGPFDPVLSDEHTNFGWFTPLEAAQKLINQYPIEFIENLSRLT